MLVRAQRAAGDVQQIGWQTMTESDKAIDDRLQLAVQIARQAGALTLDYFQDASLEVEAKADDSPVTRADREAEQLLREAIEAQFPDDSIVGEELPDRTGSSPYRWILDPIDGTKSFISGVPLYTTLVAVAEADEPLLGVIAAPALAELVYAARGQGAWFQRGEEQVQAAHVAQRSELSEACFVTTQLDSFDDRHAAEAFQLLEQACSITRTWGDGYGYMLVATGRADLMVDPIMNIWDAAAIAPVIQEAGGLFTDWQGNPTVQHGEGIATNPQLLDAVLAVTRRFPKPL